MRRKVIRARARARARMPVDRVLPFVALFARRFFPPPPLDRQQSAFLSKVVDVETDERDCTAGRLERELGEAIRRGRKSAVCMPPRVALRSNLSTCVTCVRYALYTVARALRTHAPRCTLREHGFTGVAAARYRRRRETLSLSLSSGVFGGARSGISRETVARSAARAICTIYNIATCDSRCT